MRPHADVWSLEVSDLFSSFSTLVSEIRSLAEIGID